MDNLKEKIIKLLKIIEFRIDTTKYFFDKPKFDYQPIPSVGIKQANIRGKATISRWKAIQKSIIKKDRTMKDIGSCVGYFCISASMKYGLYSLGVDMNRKFLRISRHATPIKVANKCNFINLSINKESVKSLPNTDITLCLSIWHHWVLHYGIKEATSILKQLWASTNRILFFESGEEEVWKEFNLPYSSKQMASEWLFNYLSKELNNSKVEIVSKFPAGNYKHYGFKNKKRSLFKITKKR